MSDPTENRSYWLNRYNADERRKLAYAIAHREIDEDGYAMQAMASRIMRGVETPFDYGFTAQTIEEFFVEEATSRLPKR